MTNRLAQESSPYLRQHAENPVDWYPWGEEALSAARSAGKPILLSIGYSTCHWCHVMARESFADADIASVMNSNFINIKVDREERPDLDKVYQTALQLINPQGGGWPLTMFLDPETLLPFYGGTYFPNEPRYQLPGFSDLLLRLAEVYTSQKSELDEQADKLGAALKQMTPPVLDPSMEDEALVVLGYEQLKQQYDDQEGGFGTAPKFPMPNAVNRLLRHWAYSRQFRAPDAMPKAALDMVMITLTQMARGGIYDHLGGGFCRYATDRKWMIPHFEKMLYDNAQLLSLYAAALNLGPDALFSDAVRDTVAFIERELTSPEGAFYAALDADSEGEEGRFYVWRREQIKKALTEAEYLVVETLYGLDKPANFENKWNLHRYDSWRSVVDRLSLDREEGDAHLSSAKAKLFALRAERVRPHRDEKILTAWNGLAIRGLADASMQLGERSWLESAQRAADFLRERCWVDGSLYPTFQDGRPQHDGYLDDYANLLEGLLALLSAEWRDTDARFANELASALVAEFYDTEDGGFFFTRHGHETLIHRPKPTMDDALPPGNGTAANALMKMGHLFGNTDYLDAAHNTLRWARAIMEKVPAAHCTLLQTLEETLYPADQVILRGPVDDMAEWRRAVTNGYTPWRTLYAIPYTATQPLPEYLPKLVSSEAQSRVTAFVCSGLSCSLPITDLDTLTAQLDP